MTLHLVALPHTRLDEAIPTCAYTAKAAKFRRMDLGRDLIVYGTEGADVELLNEFERRSLFGEDDPNRLPFWPTEEQWLIFNARAIAAVTELARPGDLVLLVGGYDQRIVKDALPHLTVGEPFVGYQGITSRFCAFESYAWRHHVYGREKIADGRWYDAVIPNFFDPADFPATNTGNGDYLLFVGRVTLRKGVAVAAQIAEAAGLKLIAAGPGGALSDGRLTGDHLDIDASNIDYRGPVDPAERAELMAGARALLAPTFYIEPFGGVAVEAQLCGTPVIAPDWGAFTETIENGAHGYRFATLREGVDAVAKIDDLILTPVEIRQEAIDRYSLAAVAPQFAAWFDRLDTLTGVGWHDLASSGTASMSSKVTA